MTNNTKFQGLFAAAVRQAKGQFGSSAFSKLGYHLRESMILAEVTKIIATEGIANPVEFADYATDHVADVA